MTTVREGVDTLGPIGAIILAILVFVVGKIVAGMLRSLIIKGLGKTELDDKLAKLVGHESGGTDITDVYTHLRLKDLLGVVDSVDFDV